MRYLHSKNYICTLVVSKKSSMAITVLISVIVLIIVWGGIFKCDENCYSHIYRLCSNKFAETEASKLPQEALNHIKPDAESILETAIPVFMAGKSDFEKKVINTTHDNKDNNRAATSDSTEKKPVIKENKIISDNLSIKNETSYVINAEELKNQPVIYTATGNSSKVLVLHTHACESYSDSGNLNTYRNTDNNLNMVKVGEKLVQNLNTSGIPTIHDKTQCDYPSYNMAYKNSLSVAKAHITQNPDIGFVFDIHRDAITDTDNNPVKLVYNYEDRTAAQIMIVCGTDELGLEHPHWRDNLILALKIQHYLESNYPGSVRPLNIRRERFNMHTTKGSLIFEIGSHGNTLDEALLSIDILSEAISHVLLNK